MTREPRIPLADLTEDELESLYNQVDAYAHIAARRTCLVPGCLKQYDALAAMTGEQPPSPKLSATGWKTLGMGSIFPAGGHICPTHVDIVTAHLPRRIQTPSGRWSIDCACGWSPLPQRWHRLVAALWEEHLLTELGDLPPVPPLTDPEHRAPLADHTEQSLAELYDRLWDAEDDVREARQVARAAMLAYSTAVPALLGVRTSLEALRQRITLDSRDWTRETTDAWLWAVLVGANCENTDDDHVHNDIDCAGDQALWNLGRQHDIPTDQIIRTSHLRWWIANAIKVAQQIEQNDAAGRTKEA